MISDNCEYLAAYLIKLYAFYFSLKIFDKYFKIYLIFSFSESHTIQATTSHGWQEPYSLWSMVALNDETQ